MLRFVTKKEYWECEDAKLPKRLPAAPFAWHIKNIQDAVALSWLIKCKGERIAEIGGGDSRLLEFLKSNNEVYNVDNFQGLGNGPTEQKKHDGITIIPALMGQFHEDLKEASMDTVFSISVVEHVPGNQLDAFHQDCLRILKPGGRLIHLIDVYLCDTQAENAGQAERIQRYIEWFKSKTCLPHDPQQVITRDAIKFSCAFATNPDNMMNRWNKISPKLRNLRIKAQSVSLLFVGIKNT